MVYYPYSDWLEIVANQEYLFSTIIGLSIDSNTKITSPLRYGDKSAGCKFRKFKGIMYFIDFADNPVAFNIVNFYARLTGFSKEKAENELYRIIGGISELLILKKDFTVSLKNRKKAYLNEIMYISRPWKKIDQRYWSKFGITIEELIEDGVFPITDLKIYNEESTLVNVNFYKPCYLIPLGKRIYKAYCPTCDKEMKWWTNATNNTVGNIQNYSKEEDYVIIEKSYKDSKILSQYSINNVWFQNEGQLPSPEILARIFSSKKIIIIFFDNDGPGIDAAEKVRSELVRFLDKDTLITVLDNKDYRYSDIAEIREFNLEKFNRVIEFLKRSIQFSKMFINVHNKRSNDTN